MESRIIRCLAPPRCLVSFVITLLLSSTIFAQPYDLLIKNGRVVDGSGNPWQITDIAIRDGVIQKMATIDASEARQWIDARGQIVCPGFIDVHTHIEGSVPRRPKAENFIYDGVTTLVTGNCGSSTTDLGQFFKGLQQKGISANVASLIGHNSVRREVMGNEDRAPTDEELAKMKELVRKAMKNGAVGLSTGLIYLPGAFAETKEIIALAKVAKEEGGIYVSHIRQEDHRVFDAIKEAATIGEVTGIPVQISHFKISGKSNWGQTDAMIELVNSYRSKGVDVTVDQYPYTASSTNLDVLLPEWALEGTPEEIKKRLKKKKTRKKVKVEMGEMLDKTGFENFSYGVIANCPWDKSLNGKNLSEVNQLKGRKARVEQEKETIIELVEKRRRVQMVYHKMNEQDVQALMALPYAMVASDAGIPAFGEGNPHPRAYGTNARVLGRYVRELGVLRLEDAIRKMTSFPAQKFNLKDRGLLREGMVADIVVFEADKISDTATFDESHGYSKGITYVVVNGQLVVDQGKHNETTPGQIVKRNN